jgi:predicted nucleic acid-binding protein
MNRKQLDRQKRRVNNYLSKKFKDGLRFLPEHKEAKVYISKINKYFSFSNKNLTYTGEHPYWMSFKKIELRKLFTEVAYNIEVIGDGIIIDKEGCINLESTIFQEEYFYKLKSNHLVKFRKLFPYKKINKAIVLTNYLDRNYYHWIMESIGRLAVLDQQILNEYTIVLHSKTPRFQIDSLVELFGIEPSMIHFKKETRLKVSQVLIPSFPHTRNSFSEWTNIYDADVIKKVNSISKSKTIASSKKRNFIISRKKATMRRIINEKLILEKFNDLNFEVVALEEMTFKEQMSLFRNAGIIIGTHGAGLANLIFSDNPLVIELFPSNRYNRDAFYFYQITNALEIQHVILEYNATNYERQDLIITQKIIFDIDCIIKKHFST